MKTKPGNPEKSTKLMHATLVSFFSVECIKPKTLQVIVIFVGWRMYFAGSSIGLAGLCSFLETFQAAKLIEILLGS